VRRAYAAAAAALLAVTLSGCIPATPDADTYRDKAERTLGAGVSQTTTVAMILRNLHKDKMFRPAAITQMRYSQGSLDTASTAFTELTGPAQLDDVTRKVSSWMSEAATKADDARTAIERGNRGEYLPLAKELTSLADKMEKLETSLR
jgi:hypothetical protein